MPAQAMVWANANGQVMRAARDLEAVCICADGPKNASTIGQDTAVRRVPCPDRLTVAAIR